MFQQIHSKLRKKLQGLRNALSTRGLNQIDLNSNRRELSIVFKTEIRLQSDNPPLMTKRCSVHNGTPR